MNWLIVGGAARSGTSAFLKALNSRPEIFLIPEYYWSSQIKSLDETIFRKHNTSLSKINIGEVNNQKRPGAESLLIKDFLEYIPSQEGSTRAVVEAIAKSTSLKNNLKYIGEKLPEYWKYTNFGRLAKVFKKKVKLVHIARSPLHTISSFQHRIHLSEAGKDKFRFNTLSKAIQHITESHQAYCLASSNKNIETFFIKYEDLFMEGESLKRLGAFLNVNTDKMSTFFKGEKYGSIKNLEINRAQLKLISPKLVYLSSIWDADSHLIASEIKRLWLKNSKGLNHISSKTIWHYGMTDELNDNTIEAPQNHESKSKILDSRLFLHQECVDNSLNSDNEYIMNAERNFNCSISHAFGEQLKLDGTKSDINPFIPKGDKSSLTRTKEALNNFFEALTNYGTIDSNTANQYKSNITRNYLDLLTLRECDEKGWLKNDRLYNNNTDGFYSKQIDTFHLCQLLEQHIHALSNANGNNEGLDRSRLFSFSQEELKSNNDLYVELSRICYKTLSINDGLELAPIKYKLRSATLHYSVYSDTHNYMTRLDEFPKPRLLNLHIDPLFTTRKVIIYLNPVGIEDGPFSYVPNSNKYEIKTSELLQIKAFGKASYWPNFEEREHLKQLPKMLGLTNVFGSTCNHKKLKYWSAIAAKEKLFIGNDNAIVFSPCGMHRGGIVAAGKKRIALQVILDLYKN